MNLPSPSLILDASAKTPFIGILVEGQWVATHSSQEQALVGLYRGVEACLQEATTSLEAIQSFVLCEGPGSILGIRLSAMAIRTWQALPAHREKPIYTYRSLYFARDVVKRDLDTYPFSIITESRHNTWNLLTCSSISDETNIEEISLDDAHALPAPLYHLPQRTQAPPPDHAQRLDAHLENHPDVFSTATSLLTLTQNPDAFSHSRPDYKRWQPERHR